MLCCVVLLSINFLRNACILTLRSGLLKIQHTQNI